MELPRGVLESQLTVILHQPLVRSSKITLGRPRIAGKKKAAQPKCRGGHVVVFKEPARGIRAPSEADRNSFLVRVPVRATPLLRKPKFTLKNAICCHRRLLTDGVSTVNLALTHASGAALMCTYTHTHTHTHTRTHTHTHTLSRTSGAALI